MNTDSATTQAIRRSNSVAVSEGEPGGQHQGRRSLHSMDNSHGDVEQPGASDPPVDLRLGRVSEQRAAQGCGVHGHYASAGRSTESMTWTTPFEASMSVSVTLA